MNIQMIVNDDYGNFLKSEASRHNLSVSSFIKYSLKELYDLKRAAEAEEALEDLDDSEVYSGEEYLSKIRGMIESA